jgi:pimeloyl-ACP methyl ester carboxylesterase
MDRLRWIDLHGENERSGAVRTWCPSALALSAVLLLAVSCGDGGGGTEPSPPSVARVEVSPASGSVQVGGTLQLAALPRDAGGNALSGRAGSWSSDNEAVATVSQGGRVTGVGAGSAGITATIEGKSGSATVTVPSFTLLVSKEGAGSGTVTSSPEGMDCGAACSASFGAGTVVTLTASAAVGSVFGGWSGACAGTGLTCQVTMTGVRSVTATFEVPSYSLSVTKEGAGAGTVTSSPEGIDCGSTCSAGYEGGTVVTLTASPAGASVFTGWSGACSGNSVAYQVTMSQEREVTATFSLSGAPTHKLTVWKSGTGDGTVTSDPPGIECGAYCVEEFVEGSEVTLTASASSGSGLLQWSGACSGSGSMCTVRMGAPRLVMAEFGAMPQVVSSVPEDFATNVDPWIQTVEFHFSEPMGDCAGFRSSGWSAWFKSWSTDRRTLFVTRGTAGTPLYGRQILLEPLSCRSSAGLPLGASFTLRFATGPKSPPIRVGPDPAKGFHWPYYLVLPTEMASPPTLLVEPNNSGTWSDDFRFHEERARLILDLRVPFAEDLGSPLLVPVFPRPRTPQAPEPGGIYVQALDRYSLIGVHPGLERIDLQMVAMLDDALDRLEAMGYAMDRRVFMMGFSASGAFTSRFSLIHPDRVKAAAPGAPGSWPMAPVASWQGTPLKYPVGVMDFQSLVGTPFDLETFKRVPFYIYVGDQDTNDGLDVRGMTTTERNQIYTLLNWSPTQHFQADRWPLAQAMYESVGSVAQFVVYPGVGHTITSQMLEDIKAFFRTHR